ncbi:MAG: prolipoprotein diacylglyceryl transferase [Lachnospiraceae bacterium]|nr:prolipoprotein diacylglyceryl transferase [Lachnospiraceae bacterium]
MPEWMGEDAIGFPNLGIYLEHVPREFSIFGVTIALYGLLIGIGVLLSFAVISGVAKKDGQEPERFYEVGLLCILLGIAGARIYYVIFSWDYYKNDLWSIFNIRQGGLAIYGGLIVGFLTFIIYCKRKKWDIFSMMDTAVCGIPMGQMIGRWGNFTNREVFGSYSDGLFAMRLPITAVRQRDITDELRAHIPQGGNYIQVHPTFLYEGFFNLVLMILIIVFRKKKAFNGECGLWYLGGYGIIRFFVEGIRTDRLLIPGTQLAVSQCLGIAIFLAAVAADVYFRMRKMKAAVAADAKKAVAPADGKKTAPAKSGKKESVKKAEAAKAKDAKSGSGGKKNAGEGEARKEEEARKKEDGNKKKALSGEAAEDGIAEDPVAGEKENDSEKS